MTFGPGLTSILLLTTVFELQRDENGRLFALALPWVTAPTSAKIQGARNSVTEYRFVAVLFLALIGIVGTLKGPK